METQIVREQKQLKNHLVLLSYSVGKSTELQGRWKSLSHVPMLGLDPQFPDLPHLADLPSNRK